MEVADLFQTYLFRISSSAVLFNQYADENREVDRRGAAGIRRRNLIDYVLSYELRPDIVVLAEAPGPWGCRFSGIPITSEEQLQDPVFPLKGDVSGRRGEPYSEYSARIFWRVMAGYFPRFFVWNAVPLHPHKQGKPLSIRAPGISELRDFAELTGALMEAVGPQVVVALGRKAEYQLGELGVAAEYVRHPSQGGAAAFESGMRKVFEGGG